MSQQGNTMNKETIVLLSIAVGLCLLLYFLFQSRPQKATLVGNEQAQAYGMHQFNTLHADSFIALAQKAYAPLIQIKKEGGEVEMILAKGNEMAKTFFNGNDSLLQYDMGDYDFEIKYNEAEARTTARFDILKNGGVQVPNDVLIKMLQRTQGKARTTTDSTKITNHTP